MSGSKKDGIELSEEGVSDEIPKGEEELCFRLTEERRRKLESIGFAWSAREADKKNEQSRLARNTYDDLWDSMFERLKVYKSKHGVRIHRRTKDCWSDVQI